MTKKQKMRITGNDFVQQVSAISPLTEAEAKKAIKAVVAALEAVLSQGNEVLLAGFGSFRVRHLNERNGVNPATRAKIKIAAHNQVAFKIGRRLKRLVNG